MTELKTTKELTNEDIVELSKDPMGKIDLMEAMVLFLEREHTIRTSIPVKHNPRISDN